MTDSVESPGISRQSITSFWLMIGLGAILVSVMVTSVRSYTHVGKHLPWTTMSIDSAFIECYFFIATACAAAEVQRQM
jgi:hypothetical protein